MKEKSISKSFRLLKDDVDFIVNTSKNKGITQTKFIIECINKQKNELLNSEALMIFNQLKDEFKDVNDFKNAKKISKVFNQLFINDTHKKDFILGFILGIKGVYILNEKEKIVN